MSARARRHAAAPTPTKSKNRKRHPTLLPSVKELRERAALNEALWQIGVLDCDEVAHLGNLDPATVRRECASGKLHRTHVGEGKKLRRIDPEDARAWLRGTLPPSKSPCPDCAANAAKKAANAAEKAAAAAEKRATGKSRRQPTLPTTMATSTSSAA